MICKKCQKEVSDSSNFCKFCGGESRISNNKKKLSYIFIGLSLLLLVLSTPFNDIGYLIGKLIQLIVLWTIILGIVPYLIWRFGVKSDQRATLLLIIFSILFLLASFVRFAGSVFEGYVAEVAKETLNNN